MPKEHRVVTDDAATVTVTGGVEYDREVFEHALANINRERIQDRIEQGIAVLEADLAAIPAITSLAEAKPHLERLTRACLGLARIAAGRFESDVPA